MTNEESRRASGRKLEEDRRASGRKMRDDMRALAENNRLERTLPVLPVRGKQPAKRGAAVWSGGGVTSGGGGGGIASPLTEANYNDREYYDSVMLTSDFLVAIEIKPLKKLTMSDADDNPAVFNYDYRN